MLTVMLSVFAFAQEMQQAPQKALKKQPSLKQQILMAKREGKQLNKETIAQFKVKKPVLSQFARPSRSKDAHSRNARSIKRISANSGFRRAAVVDEHGIITAPGEGTVKVYNVSGNALAYNAVTWEIESIAQSGTTKIVESTDGFVYIQDIVSVYGPGTWVKGTRTGNTITVPAGQPIYYNDSWSATLSPRWGAPNSDGRLEPVVGAAADFTFTVDEEKKTITLEGTSDKLQMGIFWDDDNTWSKFSVYATAYTYDHDYVKPEAVTPPVGLITEDWTIARYFYDEGNEDVTSEEKVLQIGFAGNDVYVNGFSYYSDNLKGTAWIKGTLSEDGKSITFAGNQCYGFDDNNNGYFFAGFDITNSALASSITAEYDAEAGIITWPDDMIIIENADESSFKEYGFFTDIVTTVKGTAPEPIPAPDVVATEWYFKSQSLSEDGETGELVGKDYTLHVKVGFAGNDVFVQGLNEVLPEIWVKGTLNPETKKVTFATGQCLGIYDFGAEYGFPGVYVLKFYLIGYGVESTQDIVMDYDAEAKTLTMDPYTNMLINAYWLLMEPYEMLKGVTMQEVPNAAATPAQPEITESELSSSMPSVGFNVPDVDVDGKPLSAEKLFYQFWSEVDGVQAPVVLDPSEYSELVEPMSEIPYTFVDNWDFYPGLFFLNMDISQWKKIGIQSIYRGGDAENKSDIAWRTIANFSVDPEFDSSKGKITVLTKALEDEEVPIKVSPNNGYKVSKVTAKVGKTTVKVNETVDEKGNVACSFVAPPADVVVNAEFETTPADFSIDIAPGNLNEAIETQLSGMQVRNLTLNLQSGDYTITKPIVAAGNLVINGKGAVIDAKDCVVTTGEGEEATSKAAPIIVLPENNEVLEKSIINERECYVIDEVTIKDVTINDIKASLIQSNNVYIVSKFLVDNSLMKLNKTDNSDAILFMNPKGYIEDMEISNSTIYEVGTKNDYFFAQYKNRPGDYTKKQIQTIKNCTFYNVGSNKKFNNQAQKGQKWQTYDIENSIFYNSYMASGFCNGMVEQLNAGYTLKFSNNTYFKNGADNSVAESSIDKSETILTSDPKFEDAANGDFSVRNKTEQALNETGDWNRWGEWVVDVYDIIIEVPLGAPGTVKAPANAQEDEEVTLEVIPEEGYSLVEGSLKVFLGKSEIELNGYTFNMPAGNVKVTAQFELSTGINAVKADELDNAVIYNMQGVRVDKAQAKGGVFIVNGRKVVVK